MALRKVLIFGAMNLILLVYRARVVFMDATELVVPVLVERQLGNDTVHFSSARSVISCNTDDKVTYLVDDRRCVSNEELLNGNYSCIIISLMPYMHACTMPVEYYVCTGR